MHSVSERDSTGGGGSGGSGAASPLTARSLRLERVAQALAHSQEELRRYVKLFFSISFTRSKFTVKKYIHTSKASSQIIIYLFKEFVSLFVTNEWMIEKFLYS